MNICIIPAGAWGTAFAVHLQRLNHTVTLCPRTYEEALEMATSRENKPYFPGHELHPDIQIGMEYKPALMEAEIILLACPTKFLRSLCRELKEYVGSPDAWGLRMIITLCKGLEEETFKLPSEVIAEELKGIPRGVLSGPTFASQVAEGQPSAIAFASTAEPELEREVQEAFSGPMLRVYSSPDLHGLELGGALKNVYAIAAGICEGLGFRDNTRAALLTRALAEMVRVGQALGGRMETFYGLSGFGDLLLTCVGKESRNRTFGELFAKGESIESLIEEKKMTVEGYRTCKSFHNLCKEREVDAPILNEIYAILYEGKSATDALETLMSRDLKPELRH